MKARVLCAAAITMLLLPFSSGLYAGGPDWHLTSVIEKGTAEADMVIRVGDIDNFGYGFEEGYNPFSGEPTPPHEYPWIPGNDDPSGTDRIMVVSGFNGNPPAGMDGYSSETTRPENSVRPIVFEYSTGDLLVKSASLQMFVDDFQAPVYGTRFKASMNGIPFPDLEKTLNSLNQTGPVGKLITVNIPEGLLKIVSEGKVSLVMDDATTGSGDGYAVDFARILINPKANGNRKISGKITDKDTGSPVEGATVSASGIVSVITPANGNYTLSGVPGGLNTVMAAKSGYLTATASVEVSDSRNGMADIRLVKGNEPPAQGTPPPVTPSFQYDKTDDWNKKSVIMKNTPEAGLMVRVGDIDNLNSGLNEGYDPFSGEPAWYNEYPWQVDQSDPAGTDRIMTPTSYKYNPDVWVDGYTESAKRPGNIPVAIKLAFPAIEISPARAILQVFVNDIQCVTAQSRVKAMINGQESAGLSKLLEQTDLTGPQGILISYNLTGDEVAGLKDGILELLLDDTITGIGDSYAVDFVRLLINPR
ncbi:MAG: carboxypeptidase regulatory-like domain-containing protein [Bacteroidales bacterium]|nr:carboxypeptidase regulatory-like domain-containing protein [Bacteroidales bacterium]